MDRASVRYFQTALASREVTDTENGTKLIKGVPVFRAGTFRDSMGDQHTWTVEHLSQMVFHFDMLRERGTLPNVPVRNQHKSFFGSGGDVVGYVEAIRVEGEDDKGNALLVADLDITEPDAFDKIERGTWRSRSSEIGFYEDNDEAMYWPVFMGLAWVDLPAVEGLFSKQEASEDKFTPVRDNEEGAVAHTKKAAEQGKGGGTGTPAPNAGEGAGEHGAPPATSKEEDDGDEGSEGGDPPSGEAGAHAKGDPAPVTPPAGTVTPPAAHGAQGQPFEFTLNGGTKTTDFAAVQAHIENLETVLNENRTQARKDFVASLASSNRIAATQVDEMTAHALSLTDEQYEAFAKMYEAAPASPLFAHHGQGNTPEPDADSEIETLRERVKMHTRSGMPEEKVKETASYKKLMSMTDNKG